MTSLIDVIFLLLLFFMLSSTFSKYGEIELTNGTTGGVIGDSPVRFVSMSGDQLMLNGRAITLPDLAQHLAPASPGDTQIVLISLDTTATSQQLVDLLLTLRGVNGVQATVLG